MCGIAGFYDSSLTKDNSEALINSMLKCISYRGPDSSAAWVNSPVVFGHNRLSIIDLSSAADQPMHFFNATIVFNGEIYNYIEIKQKLIGLGHLFSTQSDTEVILAAYREYGKNCVDHFAGMWAFAIWDNKTNELFCSRDRFGIKPFYYILEGSKFYFASECKSLFKSPLFRNDLNINQISRGLQLGWITYEDETYYSKIKILPQSCNLIFNDGNTTIEKYWTINTSVINNNKSPENEEKFSELFNRSIREHMRSDVEVGGCLSGGLDSSAIASSVAMQFPETNFKTFTIYYSGNNDVDERPWANIILDKYSSLTGYEFSPTESDVEECIDKVLYHAEVPIAGSSPISQYFVMKLAHSHGIKVLLDGQGSDEYLAGYMHSFYRILGSNLSQLKFLNAHREFYSHITTQEFSLGKAADLFAKGILTGLKSEESLYNIEYRNYYPFLVPAKGLDRIHLDKTRGSRLNQFLYHLMFKTSLPSLLHYEDRNAMAFSIESRVPFLDHRLVEFVFSLQDQDKFSKGISKNILRRSLKGIVPEQILNRTDKKGFVTPGEIKWLRGSLKHLLNINYSTLDFLNVKTTKNIIADFIGGNNKNATLVWRIAMLNRWLQ